MMTDRARALGAPAWLGVPHSRWLGARLPLPLAVPLRALVTRSSARTLARLPGMHGAGADVAGGGCVRNGGGRDAAALGNGAVGSGGGGGGACCVAGGAAMP